MVERVFAVLNRDPMEAPHRRRTDTVIAAAVGLLAVVLALTVDRERVPDALGWLLLAGSFVPLVWRRSHPLAVLLIVVACVGPYHALDNAHAAPLPGSLIALYTVAASAPPLRTLMASFGVVTVATVVMLTFNSHRELEVLRITGWILAAVVLGAQLQIYRRYIAAVIGRAERAERTREEEVGRRVAEERLRIARDLHDLLAHSITLIGVQTSVAAHVLVAKPDRLDRDAVAKALDEIAGTCRDARAELRTTLQVLRGDGKDPEGPLPDLAALPDLVRAAEGAGVHVDLAVTTPQGRLTPATSAAAYRIVQESLTNAVRHAGPAAHVRVAVEPSETALRVRVTDDGRGPRKSTAAPGFGIVGMRERARSTGGTLTAGPRPGGGFEVLATLPFDEREATA
ncbi:sensor histidine kinase [Streptomyces sp. TBY4]|uniref:sensor histidine kinase n=1 Tax=Streptomyces sp. TBY4 TaxID=2962030 RepID=UPI0020B8908C|nr:sensor histidine kinase [Streptomyces sp. TBY4]MCP3760671.1 sensor histidine kinase [Streptomyces sp. TBY4]